MINDSERRAKSCGIQYGKTLARPLSTLQCGETVGDNYTMLAEDARAKAIERRIKEADE